MVDFTSPYDHGGKQKVIISCNSGRFQEIDVGNQMIETVFYENLASPFITGSILIADSSNIFNHINFLGQEIISFTLYNVDETEFLKKSFIITGVDRYSKGNDASAVIMLNFTEEHAVTSEMTRISKSYEGKLESIVSNIITDQLSKELVTETSSQDAIRYLMPYTQSLLEAARTLTRRMSTSNGSPFYLYSTLYEDSLRLESLETMLSTTALSNVEFKYLNVSANTRGDMFDAAKQIVTMSMSNNEDIINLMRNDVFGSQYLWLDTNKDIPTELRYRFTESVPKMPTPNGTLNYDDNFTANSKQYHEGVSSLNSQITTTNIFNDINSLNEEIVIDNHMKKAESRSLKALLTKSQFDMTIPGFYFMTAGRVLGKKINVYVPKNITPMDEAGVNLNTLADKKLTGQYLVFGIRHTFKSDKYHVTMNVTKYDNKKSLSNERINVI